MANNVTGLKGSPEKLFKYMGFKDKNRNGVIDDTGWDFWRNEGYKKEVDISHDGRISIAEAKAYIHYAEKGINPDILKIYPIDDKEKAELEAIFEAELTNTGHIEDEIKRKKAVFEICNKIIKTGLFELFERVIALVSRQYNKNTRLEIWDKLFKEMSRRNLYAKASILTQEIPKEDRLFALKIIFVEMIKNKRYDEAFQIAVADKLFNYQFENPNIKIICSENIKIICSEMVRLHLHEEAKNSIMKYPDMYLRTNALRILAIEMKNAGLNKEKVKDIFILALQKAIEMQIYNYNGATSETVFINGELRHLLILRNEQRFFYHDKGIINKIVEDLAKVCSFGEILRTAEQIIKNSRENCLFVTIIDENLLLKNYNEIIPFLLRQLNRSIQEPPFWNVPWRETEKYFRPTYEAAEVIGKMARTARKANNTKAIEYIRKNALPKLAHLLTFENPRPGSDFGLVYIIYPMRIAVLQSLVNIGDASVIPNIRKCDSIDYTSPYHGNKFYSVKQEKRKAIEYLEKQSSSKNFIEPPHFEIQKNK